MKLRYILAAASVALLLPTQALAHKNHRHHTHDSDYIVPLAIGAAVLGTAIWYDNTYDHHHHPRRHRRRHRRAHVVDTYRRGGHRYRLCRRGTDYFYC